MCGFLRDGSQEVPRRNLRRCVRIDHGLLYIRLVLMARSHELALIFAEPTLPVHRRFEVCRAYFMEHLTAAAIAERFGLHLGSVQVMVRDFAADPNIEHFFVSNRPGRKTSPKREAIAQRVDGLRRAGKTLGQIRLCLQEDGYEISESYLARILREAGFSRLTPRRLPSRPGERAQDGSEVPAVADVRELLLESGRHVPTQVAGLFFCAPSAESPFPRSGRKGRLSWHAADPVAPGNVGLAGSQAVGQPARESHQRSRIG
jgi:transposase